MPCKQFLNYVNQIFQMSKLKVKKLPNNTKRRLHSPKNISFIYVRKVCQIFEVQMNHAHFSSLQCALQFYSACRINYSLLVKVTSDKQWSHSILNTKPCYLS